ncbi:hypothetical protein J6590_001794, partial [Homalodisca vitripennis]
TLLFIIRTAPLPRASSKQHTGAANRGRYPFLNSNESRREPRGSRSVKEDGVVSRGTIWLLVAQRYRPTATVNGATRVRTKEQGAATLSEDNNRADFCGTDNRC